MKGFATVLVAASVFVVAILLLSNNFAEDVSYNSNFSEMKVRISNYEVVMLQISQDCDWEKTISEIESCLNIGSEGISPSLEMPHTECTVSGFSANKEASTAFNQINCTTEMDSGKEGYFTSTISKIVKVKKYSIS